MDRFIDWLDSSNLFAPLGHAWPWALITAVFAIGALGGIIAIARRHEHAHAPLAD